MKYQWIEESEVMKKLVSAIISRAAADTKSRVEQQRLEAEYFIMSEYCELMCESIRIEHSVLLQVIKGGNKHS